MLNDKKYKGLIKTSPENQILFIINGLEQKAKIFTIINLELLKACKLSLNILEVFSKEYNLNMAIKILKQAIAKAERK